MDGNRFDRITRALAAGTTRRGVLAGIAALVVGGRAAAQPQPDCPLQGQTRNRRGDCLCPAGTDPCRDQGVCADKKRDPLNCGQCGNICSDSEICQKGKCDCAPGFERVSGTCSPSSPTGFAFNATTVEVWQALTDAKTLTDLGIPTNIAPSVGHRFQIHPVPGAKSGAIIEAEMIEVVPLRRVAFRWLNGPLDEPTTVTVTLDQDGDGSVTHLRLTHTDATGTSCREGARVLGANWGARLFTEALPRHLANLR